jgi:hypothetical protein
MDNTVNKILRLSKKQYKNLLSHIEEVDFCYICDNHPSSGHSLDCPLWEPDVEEQTKIALDDGTLELE